MEQQEKVYDSSVDYKGRIPLRASTGVWRASSFLLAIEFSERLTYYGISTSLIIYLTKVIHQDLATAAKSVNYWAGVTTLMPLLGAFIADAYLGRHSMVLTSVIIYLVGQIILTLSWYVPSIRPCSEYPCDQPRKAHEVIFFLGLYLISIGTGGHKPSLESFGADQFDDDHPKERIEKMSFFNWWNFCLCSGVIFGVTGIVYIQEHVDWGAADIILTIVMAISLAIFMAGRRFYRYLAPKGSPFTPMIQVLVAAFTKRKLRLPSDPADLYEVKSDNTNSRVLRHTNKFRFLDKAAILDVTERMPIEECPNPWRLATVTKVEEVKLIINMVPIWVVLLPSGIAIAQGSTFFVKQGTTMNCKVGNHVVIPPASLYVLSAISMIVSVTLYEKLIVPLSRKIRRNERGITILQRIGIGMVFTVMSMVAAALVERKRLGVVQNDPGQVSLSMSVFWLAPQFLIIGFGDGFMLVGMQEYFYDQVPDSMRSLGIALYLSVLGVASFLSSALITIVDHVTRKSKHSWFGKDLNSSRLDKFYWLMAALELMILCCYVFIAQRYYYKNVQSSETTRCNKQQIARSDGCNV